MRTDATGGVVFLCFYPVCVLFVALSKKELFQTRPSRALEAEMSNYSGPSWYNDAAARFPHIVIYTGRVFSPVTPEHVEADWSAYLVSLFFIPIIVWLVFLFYPIGHYVSECYRGCSCCDTERKRCECECCPRRCCRPLTLNHDAPQADAIAPVATFGFVGITLAVTALALQIISFDQIGTVIDVFNQLNDMQNNNRDLTQQAVNQMQVNQDNLQVLLRNAVNTPGVAPYAVVYLEDALFRYIQPAQDQLQTVANNVNVGLNIGSATKYTSRVRLGLLIAFVIYFAVVVGGDVATYVAAYLPRKPINSVAVTFGSIDAGFLLILGTCMITPLMGVLVGGGDLCQNPVGYINQQISNSGNSAYVSFYVNCPPGAVSPDYENLQLAYNATVSGLGLMQQFSAYSNGTFPALYNQSIVIEQGLELSLEQITKIQVMSGCEKAHGLMVKGLDQGCGNAFKSCFLWIFMTPAALLFLLMKFCLVPRKEYGGYRRIA